MTTIKGHIKLQLLDEGSKSEGVVAILTTDEDREYKLYRTNKLPQDDTFFATYDDREVTIEGEIEERYGNICVETITIVENREEVKEDKNSEEPDEAADVKDADEASETTDNKMKKEERYE